MAKKTIGKAIEIVEWSERYEVSSKGREAKPGDELKSGPLLFVRLKVYGHTQSTGYRRLKSVAGKRTMEVFGYFCKFLEIAGNQKRGQRGVLLNEKNQPATAEDLAFILDAPLEQVENAIRVLSDEKVGWITCNNLIKPNLIKPNISIPEMPEISGNATRHKYIAIDLELSKLLFKLIQKNRPEHPEPNFEKWADEVRKLREIDEKTPEQIRAVIEWAQADEFWWDKVLSTSSLRSKSKKDNVKRINRIEIQMQKGKKNGSDKISRKFAEHSEIGETIEA